jgi:hypothetical protein
MKRYKYQALVTLDSVHDSATEAALSGTACRMVVRAEHPETHRHKIFSALVSVNEGPVAQRSQHPVVLTMRVLGDDVGDYLHPGDHFVLWRGGDVGKGVVSRRLFV